MDAWCDPRVRLINSRSGYNRVIQESQSGLYTVYRGFAFHGLACKRSIYRTRLGVLVYESAQGVNQRASEKKPGSHIRATVSMVGVGIER